MGKRVLVISYVALMANMPNGRTMQSLLHGVDAEDISLIYTYGKPDIGSCKSAFCLNNSDILRSVFSFGPAGYEYNFESVNFMSNSTQTNGINKTSRNYFLREMVWSFGKWKKNLLAWVNIQKIDYILFMYGDNPAYLKMANFLKEKLNVPIIIYTCEDYYFKNYNYIDGDNKSWFFKKYHHSSVKATRTLMKNIGALIANTDLLAETYKKEFGIKYTQTITMASNMNFEENYRITDNSSVNISYLGAIAGYRKDALIDIANTLHDIDKSAVFNIYGKIDDDSILNEFEQCSNIRYGGFVSYEKVKEIMHQTNLLIEAININQYIEMDKRFGFSTKYADCFACGTPLLIYAPEGIVETQFAMEHKCAFVAKNKEELFKNLTDALYDEKKRKQQIEKAKMVTQQYFNADNNIKKYNDAVNYVLNG